MGEKWKLRMFEFNEVGGGEVGCVRLFGCFVSILLISCGIVNCNGRVGDIYEFGSCCW